MESQSQLDEDLLLREETSTQEYTTRSQGSLCSGLEHQEVEEVVNQGLREADYSGSSRGELDFNK